MVAKNVAHMSIDLTEREIILLVEGTVLLREKATPPHKGRQAKKQISVPEVEELLVKLCVAQHRIGAE